MQFEEMIQYLIAVGASIGVDCEPCFQSCLELARRCGADEQAITAAMAVGDKVRQCAEKAQKTTNNQEDKFQTVDKILAACSANDEIST